MKFPDGREIEIDPPQDLVILIERMRMAVDAMKANGRDWERNAIAAQWLEFEIGTGAAA